MCVALHELGVVGWVGILSWCFRGQLFSLRRPTTTTTTTVVVMLCFCVCVPAATNEGSVPMSENEEMQILEEDQGDGWTRVRKSDASEGFVPSSYIQCHYYGQDQV